MKILIYTRISPRGSDWTGETSCASQADEVRRFILRTDPGATFRVESDELVSGTHNRRPALRRILDGIATADWDALAVVDIDRVSRSQEGWLEIIRLLADHNKGFVAVRQNADFSTPQGRFMLSLFVLVGEYFAKQNAQKTRDKMYFIARRGEWPAGVVPMGYRRGGAKDNVLKVDEAWAVTVRAMFADAAKGLGPVVIARKYKIPKNTVYKVLSNPIYRGRLVYGEVDVPGKHAALVDDATWQAAQSVAPASGPKPRPNAQTYPYLLAGVVKCQCGGAMSPAICCGHGGRYPYYRCQNPQCHAAGRYVRADHLDREVLRSVAGLVYSPEACAALAKAETDRRRRESEAASPEISRLRSACLQAQQAISGLTASLAASNQSGFVGASRAIFEDLERRQTELTANQAALEAAEAAADDVIDPSEAAAWIDDWSAFAAGIADGTLDPRVRQAWARAHVRAVRFNGTAWQASYWVPGKCSTRRPKWHPEGCLIELRFTLPRRAA